MYLRTTQRKNKDGSIVKYLQLAHNIRQQDTKQTTADIIYNFGRADKVDRNELKRLCQSIARVCGGTINDPFEEHSENSKNNEKIDDFIKDYKWIIAVELGCIYAIDALWETLGIGQTLRKIQKLKKCKVPYERALMAMTANRLCKPESKLGVWDRWLKTVYFPEGNSLKLDHMYEAMDLLYEHHETIEKTIFFNVADLLNLDVDLVFYDTTTTSFSIDMEEPDEDEDDEEAEVSLRKRGHNKDGTWSVQVVIALAVTRDGLPVRSWVFPGNTTDVNTVQSVKKDLKGWKLGRAMFVADGGMNSEENRRQLAKACGKYILAMRAGSVKEIKEEVLSTSGRYKKIADNLHAKEVIIGDGERRRRYILCYNRNEATRKRKHRREVLADLKSKLKEHPDKSATAKWAIKLLASGRYQRYLKITEDNKVSIDSEAVRSAQRYDGKWVLITNDDTITIEDAVRGYKGLMVIERCFRALKKTQIKMGPMFHWLPHRIVAHVKICVLGLLIQRYAEIKCQCPWSKIRAGLAMLQAGEYKTSGYRFYRRNEILPPSRAMLKSLGISTPKPVLGISPLT
jgi:transposase